MPARVTYTVPEIAALLGISRATAYALLRDRRDPGPPHRLSMDHRLPPLRPLAAGRFGRGYSMRGSIRKRCQCRDEEGRPLKQCRKAHGSWSFVIDAGYDPRTGKRRQIRRSGYRTRDEANEAMTRELASLAAGTWTDDQGLRLDAWLDQWLAEFAARGRSPKTLALYTAHVANFWRPQLGHIRLRDLRRGTRRGSCTDSDAASDRRPEGRELG